MKLSDGIRNRIVILLDDGYSPESALVKELQHAVDDAVQLEAETGELKKKAWWKRMSNEDVAAELSATFDLGLKTTRKIATWILT